MSLSATAVEILIDKGRFEPEVALGIAEAIETTMTKSEFVTVPILDARLHELRADTRMSLLSLEHKMDARFQDLKTGMDRRFAETDARVDRKCGDLELKMERIKADLVRWVFLVMLGNVALSAGATAALNHLR
jgi:hypothetical protein